MTLLLLTAVFEMQLTRETIQPFRVYQSVVFSIFTLLTHWLFRMEHLCFWPQWGSLST